MKISKEHYISNNILADFEKNRAVKLAGLPWMEKQTFNLLSRSKLVSNILCTKHNQDLSPFDREAGDFLRCIKDFDAGFNIETPVNEVKQFNGEYIEKWMLKTICALIASGQVAQNGHRVPVILKEIYVDLLFNNAAWPDGWGLYFKAPVNTQVHKFDSVNIMPMMGNGEVKCVEFLLHNFTFYLALGKPDNPDHSGIRHIHKIQFTDGKVTKIMELQWNDPADNHWIEFKRLKTTTGFPSNYEEWMKK